MLGKRRHAPNMKVRSPQVYVLSSYRGLLQYVFVVRVNINVCDSVYMRQKSETAKYHGRP